MARKPLRRVSLLSPVGFTVALILTTACFALPHLFPFLPQKPREWHVDLLLAAGCVGAGYLAQWIYLATRPPTGVEVADRKNRERTEAFLGGLDRSDDARRDPPAPE